MVVEFGECAVDYGSRQLLRGGEAVYLLPTPRPVLVSAGRATVEDLGSMNGTFLHGHRLTQLSPLSDGDEIRLGQVRMTFRVLAPVSTRTAAAD